MASALVVKVAVPETTCPVPNTVTPSLKVTVPVAGPPVTAAVKVTAELYGAAAPSDDVKLVVVATGPTVTVPAPVKYVSFLLVADDRLEP
jgi:hypothetical protein